MHIPSMILSVTSSRAWAASQFGRVGWECFSNSIYVSPLLHFLFTHAGNVAVMAGAAVIIVSL